MFFVYDKDNDLINVFNLKNKEIDIFYAVNENQLKTVEIFKDKNKIKNRKTFSKFNCSIKLWYNSLVGYNYSIKVIKKKSKNIIFPTQTSRIEVDEDGIPKFFTVSSDLIKQLLSKL